MSGMGGPQAIYQTQQQRKSKLIQGDSFFTDHNRGNSQGGISAGSASHFQTSNAMPTKPAKPVNSNIRTADKVSGPRSNADLGLVQGKVN